MAEGFYFSEILDVIKNLSEPSYINDDSEHFKYVEDYDNILPSMNICEILLNNLDEDFKMIFNDYLMIILKRKYKYIIIDYAETIGINNELREFKISSTENFDEISEIINDFF